MSILHTTFNWRIVLEKTFDQWIPYILLSIDTLCLQSWCLKKYMVTSFWVCVSVSWQENPTIGQWVRHYEMKSFLTGQGKLYLFFDKEKFHWEFLKVLWLLHSKGWKLLHSYDIYSLSDISASEPWILANNCIIR